MADPQETPGQTVGPFFADALSFPAASGLAGTGQPGAIRLHGVVYDGAGEPIDDALVELWQGTGFGRCATDAVGRYAFSTVAPPAFFALTVFARGLLNRLFTRAYLPGSEPALLGLDVTRRRTLIATADSGGYRFDIHLQGPDETVFLEYRDGGRR